MIIKIFQNDEEIGDVLYFSITNNVMFLRDIRYSKGIILKGNVEFEIKYITIETEEEELYKCNLISCGQIFVSNNICSCEYMKCNFSKKTKVEEEHKGQIYNPYNDTWSWF